MLTLALATIFSSQKPTITFKSNFEPLGRVVERLSSETSIPMAAFGDLKAYPVYVNVKDVQVNDLLDRLAKVSGGEWEKKDGNYYLIAPQTLRNDQAKAGDADLIAAIEATISQPAPKKKSQADFEKMGKEMEKDPQNAQNMTKMIGEIFGQMFQADEGTMELLKVIGSKDLSSIVDGRRVVLSSTPNPMQVLMPSKAITAIKNHLKKLAAEAPKAKDGGDKEGFDFMSMFGGQSIKHPELVNQVQTIQAVFQIAQRKTLTVELSAYTADGVGVYSRTVQMPIVNPEEARPKVQGETKLDVAKVARDYAQALEDGKEIDPFLGMIMNAQSGIAGAISMFASADSPLSQPPKTPQAISASMRQLMTEPDKNEPLSFLLGPLLDSEAAHGKNIVALPSDDVIQTLATHLLLPNATVEGVLDEIDRTMTEKVSQDGTWEIMEASSPLELRSAFCKRDALSNLIKSGLTRGYVNLDDCSRFATVQDTARGSEILALPLITAVFHTSDMGSATALTNAGFDSLKLYATLTDFQKQALAAKRPVPLASLTPAQSNILARMVYHGMMPPMKSSSEMEQMFGEDTEGGGMAGLAGLGMAMAGPLMSAFGMGDVQMDSERTNLLPNGIPVVGSLQLKTIDMESVMATDTATGNNMITMPELLGVMNSDIPGMGSMKRSFDQYKLAKQKSYLLYFQLGKNASYFTSLYDVWVDDSKTYTKDQLPEELRNRMKGIEIPKGVGKADTPPPAPR